MNLEDEKSWSFFMPQVKLSLLAGILLQQPPGMERWLRSSRTGCTIAHGTHAANRQNTHDQMRKLTRGQAPLTAPQKFGQTSQATENLYYHSSRN